MTDTIDRDLDGLARLKRARDEIRRQAGTAIVGQDEVVSQLLVCLFARGHCVLEGVPGLAKTLLIRTLARCLSLDFNRVQFTPDLMPSDITGTDVMYDDKTTGQREFRFLKGPLFANVVLADEINRTPPKTQAALLEAMQERQVSAGGKRHGLPDPFFVLATQNPIEQEGTYPLPEAQLDRFLLKIYGRLGRRPPRRPVDHHGQPRPRRPRRPARGGRRRHQGRRPRRPAAPRRPELHRPEPGPDPRDGPETAGRRGPTAQRPGQGAVAGRGRVALTPLSGRPEWPRLMTD